VLGLDLVRSKLPADWCQRAGRAIPAFSTLHDADGQERYAMSQLNGDKSRFNRERRKKIARRAINRAVRAKWEAKAAATPPPARPSDH
jgi:hypothetical protein